jgi:hypothetical protein
MTLKRVLREVRDILSYCGLGVLVAHGFKTAFAYPGLTLVRQHRWLGYGILASALAIADRLRTAGQAAGAKREQALPG